MKILFAGANSELSSLKRMLRRERCEITQVKDDGQLFHGGQQLTDCYDWVILGGHFLAGEKDFAPLRGMGDAFESSGAGCGVRKAADGTLEFRCDKHSTVCDSLKSGTDEAGFSFEYHAPCRARS